MIEQGRSKYEVVKSKKSEKKGGNKEAVKQIAQVDTPKKGKSSSKDTKSKEVVKETKSKTHKSKTKSKK